MTSPTTDRRLGLVGNIAMKAPVTALASSNITQSGQQTIDGVAVLAINAAGVPDRVLCTGMTDGTKNGIWDVSTAAWTRSKDADGNYDLGQGSTVLVNGGSNAGSYWKLNTAAPITIGTTSMTWALALASSSATMGFTQSGTGAVARTSQSKMRDVVSVLDFGATGDGTTDDTLAIQAAIDAAYLRKAACYFPANVYKISNPLTSSNVLLYGDGTWCTYILQSGTTKDGVRFDCNYASGGGFRDISIHAVTTNPGQTKSSGIGLKVNRGNGNFRASNFDINGFAVGIQSAANFYTFFDNFQVLNASTAALSLGNTPVGAYFDSAGVFWSNAKLSNFGTASANGASHAMLIDLSAGDHFTSIDATSFGTGIKIAPNGGGYAAHLFFDRVLADTCISNSWVLDSTNGAITDINMVDCWAAFSTTGYGVYITGATNNIDDVKWTGGNIRENGQHGVFANWGKNIRFVGTAIATNSKQTTNTYMGAYLSGAGLLSIAFDDCTIGNFSTTALHLQLNNVYIDAAVAGRVSINSCDLSVPGTAGSPLVNLSTSVDLLMHGNHPRQNGLNKVGSGNMLRGVSTAGVAAGSTVFLGPSGQSATEANAVYVPGFKGSATKISVSVDVAPGSGKTFTFTLRKNGVDTALVATITGAATFIGTAAGNITFDDTDSISLKLGTQAGAATSSPRWVIETGP